MLIIVATNDGEEKFVYQTDTESRECNTCPSQEDTSAVLYALFIATMFLSRAGIGLPLGRPEPAADSIATLTPG